MLPLTLTNRFVGKRSTGFEDCTVIWIFLDRVSLAIMTPSSTETTEPSLVYIDLHSLSSQNIQTVYHPR